MVQILTMKQVTKFLGLSRATVDRAEESGDFPTRIILTSGRVGYLEDEILEWLKRRRKKSVADRMEAFAQ